MRFWFVSSPTLFDVQFIRDSLGRITQKTETIQGGIDNFDYGYDVAGQLTEVKKNGAVISSYSYDSNGNRLALTTSAGTVNATYDDQDRLLTYGNSTYNYTANGELQSKTISGQTTTYEYDAENKLARATVNGTIADYKYDALGRRVEKQVADGPTTTVTRYIYDNEDILLEVDGANNITARYTHGPGIDEPLVIEKSGASFFYHADGLGSITEITDATGALKQRYTYSSFGKIESQLDPSFIQPYAFTGREFDLETGLYFYRARYYDPATGRFLQEDPLGIDGGINVYTYVNNRPIVLIDPSGKVPLIIPLIVIGASYGAIENAIIAAGAGHSWTTVGRQAFIGGVAGAAGTAAGVVTALYGTKNPATVGVAANVTYGLVNKLLQQQNVSIGDILADALVGALAGQLAHGLMAPHVRGREPDLFAWRPFSKYGSKSIELLIEAFLGGFLGLEGDLFFEMMRRAGCL